jgi:hypothetical protein
MESDKGCGIYICIYPFFTFLPERGGGRISLLQSPGYYLSPCLPLWWWGGGGGVVKDLKYDSKGEEITIQYISFLFGNIRRRKDIKVPLK